MQETAHMQSLGGKTILHYAITAQLGAGSMGVVYKAYDTKLKRHVALKFLPPHRQNEQIDRTRLEREAIAASCLDHPNIGVVHAIERTADDQMFMVMAYYEGETLAQRIARGRVPVSETVAIATQIASGLAQAHSAGIVHRDLKPSNIILTRLSVAKIVDFGIAKIASESDVTEPGMTVGTVAYMSPEQVHGEPADGRADIWALGVIVYQMLTAVLPFVGENKVAVMKAIATRPAPISPSLEPLASVIDRCLRKPRAERYQDAYQLLQDLSAVHVTSPETTPTEPLERLRYRSLSRRRLLLASVAAVLACLLAWCLMRRSAFPTKHIAVLPFHSAQSEAADQALADGLSEVITASLRRLEANDRDLLVVPSQDIQSQHVSDVRAARRAYSVKLVVLGDVAHENGQVRLAITVVDAARERPMASTTIQEREDRLALVHTRAVQEVSRMLGVRPSPANPSPVPPSVYAAWLRGRGFLDRFDKSANVASAITEFESALTAAPAYTPALVGLGQAYLNRFDTTKDPRWLDAALGSAAKAIEVDHDSAEAYTVRGGVHNARGEYKEAVEDFERALILNARLDDAYRGLARAFERMGLMQRAEATYEKAIAARPDYWAGYHWLAAFHYKYGRYQAAAGQFRRVVQLTPDNAQAYSNLGSALAKLGKLDEARRMYETAIRIAPSYGAYNNFANLLLRQRLFAEAAAAYEKALELNSQDHNVWGNLGAAYLRTPGQKSRANDAYRRAIQLAEKARSAGLGDPNLLARLAQYYAIQGKRSEPLELLRTALAQAPTDVSVLISAAITYETLGFREEALQWVRKSLELGYPRLEVEQTPDFDELRKDRRFLESIPSPK